MENDMMEAAVGCPHIKTLRVLETLRVFPLRGLLNFSREFHSAAPSHETL